MSDTEQQDTNHKQPASKTAKSASAAGESAAATVSEAVDAAVDTATTAVDEATDGPSTDGAATDAHSAIDGLSQAAGEAAQRAGVAAQRAGVAAQRAGEVLTDVAGDVASTVSAHAPAVIDASRATAGIAAREVRSASSENLVLGTVFSSGLAFGLMLARAPRVLVLLALTPVVVFGANLVGRRNNRGPKSAAPSTAGKPAAKADGALKGKSSAD
jgi:hypothetical protein